MTQAERRTEAKSGFAASAAIVACACLHRRIENWSLEVFAVGCVCSLFGRLLFLTYGVGLEMQIAINVVGLATMFLVGLLLERRRYAPLRKTLPSGAA